MSHLKDLRNQRHLSQTALHISTGIDQSLLSKYERGERFPSSSDLIVLADFFQTSVDYLLNRTDVKEPYPPKAIL
ncbi:MAG: helix-turn-helix transcriptional regulator [Clostridia bacterium]